MRIIQCGSKEEAVSVVSSLIEERISAHPSSVIGLATGRTMIPVYERLAASSMESGLDLSSAFFFMLDEYYGLPDGHPSSFKYFIQKHVVEPLNLKESQFAFPPVHAENGADHYEQSIREAGGVDLQLLGIGTNGHVGFNEPGSSPDSRTRRVALTPETIEANRDQFVDDLIPQDALSMGLGTIMEAKSLVMLATGKSKAQVIKYLLNHHDDPSCPATFLKSHPHLTIVLDPEALSSINLNI